MIAHKYQRGVAQQIVVVKIIKQSVIRIVAELGVLDEIMGQTSLPKKTKVWIVGKLFGDFARVMQQMIVI